MSEAGGDQHDNNDDCFYDSLDRILSSTNSSCSSSSSNSDDEQNGDFSFSNDPKFCRSPEYDSPASAVPKFPIGVSNNYDVWISQPSSVEERRMRLLRQMGLSGDPSLSRQKPSLALNSGGGGGKFSKSVSGDYLSVSLNNSGIVRSKSADQELCNSSPSSSSVEILSINSISSTSRSPVVYETPLSIVNNPNQNHHIIVDKPPSVNANAVLPNKPPTGKHGKRNEEIIRIDSAIVINDVVASNGNGVVEVEMNDFGCNGIGRENDPVCTIKNLDNGKEFVVNQVREDGTLDNVKEVGTGRHLTMEEFEMCVGQSPIVQELMRRQNVESGNKDTLDLNVNGSSGSGSKLKKKGSWLRSIKNAASSVTGNKERRSSDDKDTSSEKGGRRSSSATDDSQDGSFHGAERVRVRQYGKSCKDLTALYKSQEIQAHTGCIWTIKFSLDGKFLASAGEDCVIHVWQVGSSERKGDLIFDKPEDGNMNILLLANGSPEPNLLSPNLDGLPEKKRRGKLSISRKSVSLDHIVMPETVFALSEKPVCSFKGHLDDVLDLSWSKSQITRLPGMVVTVWEIRYIMGIEKSIKIVRSIIPCKMYTNVSKDEESGITRKHLLSSSMDKTVRLWQLSSKSCLKTFSHSDYVTCIQFNPVDDRYFISGSLDAKVRIWSIPDRQVVDWNDLHEMVTAACYTPDGQAALVGTYKGSCRWYNTAENKLQQKSQINLQNKKKKAHHKKITGFQFSPGSSSEVLITSADSRVRVVDGVDLVHKFKGFRNTNSQISASLTANGKYVVSASEDSHVYVWKHEADSRPSRSKGVTVTQSYEHFHCQDVSAAIPWPGISGDTSSSCVFQDNNYSGPLDEVNAVNHPPTPAEVNGDVNSPLTSGCTSSPLHGIISNATNSYFFDRISATWPEEKLVLASKHRCSPQASVDLSSNGVNPSKTAWGMVIVTAGLRGEIRIFQNFGLPVRI